MLNTGRFFADCGKQQVAFLDVKRSFIKYTTEQLTSQFTVPF